MNIRFYFENVRQNTYFILDFSQIQGVRQTAHMQNQGVWHEKLGVSDSRTIVSVEPCLDYDIFFYFFKLNICFFSIF